MNDFLFIAYRNPVSDDDDDAVLFTKAQDVRKAHQAIRERVWFRKTFTVRPATEREREVYESMSPRARGAVTIRKV
jgi:hypothetical protein